MPSRARGEGRPERPLTAGARRAPRRRRDAARSRAAIAGHSCGMHHSTPRLASSSLMARVMPSTKRTVTLAFRSASSASCSIRSALVYSVDVVDRIH